MNNQSHSTTPIGFSRRLRQLAVVAASCAAILASVSGCASMTGYPDRSIDPEKEIESVQSYLKPEKIQEYERETDSATKKLLRNDIVNARLYAIDIHFGEFERSLYQEGVGFGVGTDWAALATSGAAAIVGGGAGQALAGTASGIIGAQGSFQKRAFFDRTMPVIMAEMVAQRAKVEARIRKGLTLDDGEYSLFQALPELEAYYQAGTMTAAFATLAQAAGETAKEARVELSRIRDEQWVDESKQKRIDALLDAIDALDDAAATNLARNPPVQDAEIENLVKLLDPTNQRSTDGEVAKQILKTRLVLSGERSEEELSVWNAAVTAVEKRSTTEPVAPTSQPVAPTEESVAPTSQPVAPKE